MIVIQTCSKSYYCIVVHNPKLESFCYILSPRPIFVFGVIVRLTVFCFHVSSQLLWAPIAGPDQRMYPPSRQDFISLTLSDPHNNTYNNGKHRRQSCWRVSGTVVQG